MRMLFLGFMLLLLAGTVWLQIFLSKTERKWPGLILPVICLCFSLLPVFSIPAYHSVTITEQTVSESGEVIKHVTKEKAKMTAGETASVLVTSLVILGIFNIPTVIYLGIYGACRGKRKKSQELEKMNIQDLE